MQNGSLPLNSPRVLVLSDNEVLSKVVELLLVPRQGVQIWRLRIDRTSEALESSTAGSFDLIILMLRLPFRDPIACLAQAGLEAVWKKTPVIVSSGSQVPVHLAGNMIHIGFPFEIDGLQAAIQEILGNSNAYKNHPLREYTKS
jgi:CheY-like chemotaxis protein